MRKRSFFKKLFWVVNLLFGLLLILACAISYGMLERLSFLSILSLSVPVLVGIHLVFVLFWLVVKKKYALLSASCLFVAYMVFGNFFEFGSQTSISATEDLSIMSYNVRVFNRNEDFDDEDIPEKIQNFINKHNPDILCFQEFNHNFADVFEQYPYSYISYEELGEKALLAVFSKYPITNSGSLSFPKTGNNAVFADIQYKKDTIRVYNLHMESLKIQPNAAAIASESSDKLFKRLHTSFGKQELQASLYKKHSAKTSYPKIVCGDFNNTQFSHVYRTIKADLRDSFREKGVGFGKTFDFMGVPMRIDFILVDETLQVMTHQNFEVSLSDHFPIMSTVRFSSKP